VFTRRFFVCLNAILRDCFRFLAQSSRGDVRRTMILSPEDIDDVVKIIRFQARVSRKFRDKMSAWSLYKVFSNAKEGVSDCASLTTIWIRMLVPLKHQFSVPGSFRTLEGAFRGACKFRDLLKSVQLVGTFQNEYEQTSQQGADPRRLP
jgi:hypothetical protein